MTSSQLEASSQIASDPSLSSGPEKLTKQQVRTSLQASTLDGVFSAVFENVIRGVLISNFLIGIGAGAAEIGLLTSIPLLTYLLQPLGAYLSEKSASRHHYCLWVYGLSRVLWLGLMAGIFLVSQRHLDPHWLILATIICLALCYILDSLGNAAWMSWMAVIVPNQLRGRYFSLRKSLSSLTALLVLPLGGWLVAAWPRGELEGYGVALAIAVAAGMVSMAFQFLMADVNPQTDAESAAAVATERASPPAQRFWQDRNFLVLLLFLAAWTFGINLSTPFVNFYLLDKLSLDVRWVTFYSGISAAAFLLMIMLWGRWADRVGNRPVLLLNCMLTAIVPLLWLCTSSQPLSVWLWLPLLHVLQGATFAALELCLMNIQMELAPVGRQSAYFAIAAAVIGISGALSTTLGGFLAELPGFGLPALFALSAVLRSLGILPLFFVQESRSRSIRKMLGSYLPIRLRLAKVSGQ
ncbi:MFS transporter [Vasconcelosia minhoensis]|uniref:MFS transporter n=1 Tax=Vasconcelosia minhoensis TaxID=3366354 RepID=UPI001D1362DD|nr:MFS transporter [Romeria gracilis]